MPRTPKQFEEIRTKTRNIILNSALELFALKGYTATSISDIAKAAGISKGLAYNYFDSKQKLVEAVLEMINTEFEEITHQIERVVDPFKQIKLLLKITFEQYESNMNFWFLYFSVATQPQLTKTALKVSENFFNDFFRMLESAFRKIGIKNAAAEAKLLGALLDGIGIHYIFFSDKYPIEQIKKQLLKKYGKRELQKLTTK